jgi:hypothetical protein
MNDEYLKQFLRELKIIRICAAVAVMVYLVGSLWHAFTGTNHL